MVSQHAKRCGVSVYLCVILAVLVVPCLVQADLLDFKAEPAACGWKSAETDCTSGPAIMVIAAHALPVLHKPVPEPGGLLLTSLIRPQECHRLPPDKLGWACAAPGVDERVSSGCAEDQAAIFIRRTRSHKPNAPTAVRSNVAGSGTVPDSDGKRSGLASAVSICAAVSWSSAPFG